MADHHLWGQLSFAEQMGQIGRELKHAREAEEDDDQESRDEFIDSALTLLEQTLKDARFHQRISELEYLHTAIMAWRIGNPTWTPQAMINYCISFLLDEDLPNKMIFDA